MNDSLHLDTTNGRLSAAGIAADAGTRADALPPAFTTTAQAVQVEGRRVDCVFARTTAISGDMSVQLELRFEEGLLVSSFLTLWTPALRKLADHDFHGSTGQRERLHLRWLSSMGIDNAPAAFSWGSAGVMRDRSDNVCIYMHNRNNRWAHG